LEAERHPFADYCLKRIEERSPLALEVTLKLLRNARDLSYYDILVEEMNATKKLVLHSKDFEAIMKNKMLPHDKRDKHVRYSKTLKQLSKADIEFYFTNPEEVLKNITLEIKKNSLLPVRVFKVFISGIPVQTA
jgi:hypothetical protein